ncbi:hypothetical protein [Salinispira pacifica]|uniref:hypothetical protein n=1 Tax=Salinispira pacifica TaxID=1307761 RepID=UPI00059D7D44|nr:hypothetical protein [Salinispira pacifica]
MKRKIDQTVEKIVDVVSSWSCCHTITLMENERDFYDPYFFVSLDIYYEDEIPSAEKRAEAFVFAGGFETAGLNRKDRFLVDEIPVRLEYKNLDRFDTLLNDSLESSASLRDSGTYMFYRMMESEILYAKSDWLVEARKSLEHLDDRFWNLIKQNARARMEHYFGDVSAAVMQKDELFFTISAGGFVKNVCGVLFAANKVFEPSPRLLLERLSDLKSVPDDFQGLLESFIRHNDTSLTRKKEIAGLLAKRIIQL